MLEVQFFVKDTCFNSGHDILVVLILRLRTSKNKTKNQTKQNRKTTKTHTQHPPPKKPQTKPNQTTKNKTKTQTNQPTNKLWLALTERKSSCSHECKELTREVVQISEKEKHWLKSLSFYWQQCFRLAFSLTLGTAASNTEPLYHLEQKSIAEM